MPKAPEEKFFGTDMRIHEEVMGEKLQNFGYSTSFFGNFFFKLDVFGHQGCKNDIKMGIWNTRGPLGPLLEKA